MNNQKCPKCEQIFDFKNMMVFDDKQMLVKGIVYLIECQNCKTVFVTDMRTADAMKQKNAKKLLKEMEDKLGNKR